MSKHQEKPTSAVFIALFFYQAGFTSIIGKSNMYTDVVATVGVCGFLWHCLAPLASQLLLHPRQQKWKKGKQAETGFSIKNHSKNLIKFWRRQADTQKTRMMFFVFFHLRVSTNSRVSEHKSLRFLAAFWQDSTLAAVLQLPRALRIIAVAHVWESKEHRNIQIPMVINFDVF